MMAAANGHIEAMQALLYAGAECNAVNERKNTALHWAVFTTQLEAVKTLLAHGGCDLLIRNDDGRTAVMDADQSDKGDLVELILNSLGDENHAAAALGHSEEKEKKHEEKKQQVEQLEPQAGVDQTIDGKEIKAWQE